MSSSVYATKVSVIIPHFRRPKTLNQTLCSLLRQTHDLNLIEIIVVDDGSPHNERPDISKFENRMDIKVLYQSDMGYRLAKARNLGILHATNDTIILLDCDLAVSPQFITRHLDALFGNHRNISIGLRDSRHVDDDLDPFVFEQKHPSEIGTFLKRDWRLTTHLDQDPNYANSNAAWMLCSGGNVAFLRSTFEDVGPYDERFVFWGGEDTEWAYRAYKKGYTFRVDFEINSYHFDCRTYEYQTDRYLDLEKKNALLTSLVPAFERGYLVPNGEVPYVSVFVTHYNKLEYLNAALASIPSATSTRFEVVLVDDHSDCTVSEIEDQIPCGLVDNVRIFRLDEHVGVEKCYAYAIQMCKGEFIAQLDADDYLLPDAIDKLIDCLKNTNSDLAYGRHKILDNGELRDGWVCREATREMRLFRGMYYHPLRVFRANALNKLGGMRILGLDGGVDYSVYSQIELASKATFCDEFTYVYRKVDGSITAERFDAQVDAVFKVVKANANIAFGEGSYTLTQLGQRMYRVTHP